MGENGGLVIKIIVPSDRGVAKARPGWARARPKFILFVCVRALVLLAQWLSLQQVPSQYQ